MIELFGILAAAFAVIYVSCLFSGEPKPFRQKSKDAAWFALQATGWLLLMGAAPIIAAFIINALFGAGAPEPGETDW